MGSSQNLLHAEQPEFSEPVFVEEMVQYSLRPSLVPTLTDPGLSYAEDLRAGCSTSGGVSRMQSRGRESLLKVARIASTHYHLLIQHLCKAALSVLMSGIAPTLVHHLALGLFEPCFGPTFQVCPGPFGWYSFFSVVSTAPLSFMLFTNLLRVHLQSTLVFSISVVTRDVLGQMHQILALFHKKISVKSNRIVNLAFIVGVRNQTYFIEKDFRRSWIAYQ